MRFWLRTILPLIGVTAAASVLAFMPVAAADTTTPPSPPDFRVTQVGFDNVTLAWSRVSGAEFYRVLVNGVWRNGAYDPTTTVTVTQLMPGVTYTFEVQAREFGGEFGTGSTLRASTRADNEPPSAPTGLREARDGNGRSIGITWTASTDNWGVNPGYIINADGRFAMFGGAPTEWYWLTDPYHGGLSCGTRYTFTIQAVDKNGNRSAHSAPLVASTPVC